MFSFSSPETGNCASYCVFIFRIHSCYWVVVKKRKEQKRKEEINTDAIKLNLHNSLIRGESTYNFYLISCMAMNQAAFLIHIH